MFLLFRGLLPTLCSNQKRSAVEINLFNVILLHHWQIADSPMPANEIVDAEIQWPMEGLCWYHVSLFSILNCVFLASPECTLGSDARSKPYCRLTFLIKSSSPRVCGAGSADLSALFTVSRTLTNSNLIFCLLVALHRGKRLCREIKVNPKLVYQNCDAPKAFRRILDLRVIDQNIYRQSLLFIVQMFYANVFAHFFSFS